MKAHLIYARCPRGGIGINGALPWSLKDDLKAFKELTLGQIVIMGRKTFDSIKTPLFGRTVWVLSRDESIVSSESFTVFRSVPDVVAECERLDIGMVCVVGGAEVYKAFEAYTVQVTETLVNGVFECDAHYSARDIDGMHWLQPEYQPESAHNSHSFYTYRAYKVDFVREVVSDILCILKQAIQVR